MGGFAAGEIQLDGAEALAYARARYTSVVAESNDFARSVRQARILGALRTKLGEGGIGAILPGLSLMDAMEDRVRTDMSAIDLFLLSSHLASDRRVELTEDVALTATTNTIGQYILIPTGWSGPGDYGGLQAYLAAELASPVEPVAFRCAVGGGSGRPTFRGSSSAARSHSPGCSVAATAASRARMSLPPMRRRRILVVRTTYLGPGWMLPGGRVERGETPHAAAVRETLEETGLHVRVERLVLVDAHRASDVSFVFRGHVEGGELEPQFGEIAEAGWVDRDEIARTSPRLHRLLELIDRGDGVVYLGLPPMTRAR